MLINVLVARLLQGHCNKYSSLGYCKVTATSTPYSAAAENVEYIAFLIIALVYKFVYTIGLFALGTHNIGSSTSSRTNISMCPRDK